MMSENLLKICISLFVLLACLQQIIAHKTTCAHAIDDVLQTICEDGYDIKSKMSMEWNAFGDDELEDGLPSRYAGLPFLPKIHGNLVDTLTKSYPGSRGVYDECCLKPCTYNELYFYCEKK